MYEIRTLWTDVEKMAPEMAAFYKLRLITAQRGKEVSSMTWADMDLESGWWIIPAAIAKNKLGHRVPIDDSTRASAIAHRLRKGEADVLITGYPILFGSKSVDLGGFVEIVRPEAVDHALATSADVVALRNHDSNMPLGRRSARTLTLRKDAA